MNYFKSTSSKFAESVIKTDINQTTVTSVDYIKEPALIEPAELQQGTYVAIVEKATHYVDVVNNNLFDIPASTFPDVSNISADIAGNQNLNLDPKINVQVVGAIGRVIANPPKVGEGSLKEPTAVKIIDFSPPIDNADINLYLSPPKKPIQVNVQISDTVTISKTSNALSNIETLNSISPKILLSMQAKALVSQGNTTKAGTQFAIYNAYSKLKLDTFTQLVTRTVRQDANVTRILSAVSANKIAAKKTLNDIDQTLGTFLNIENSINDIFYISAKPLEITSPTYLNVRGLSGTSRSKFNRFTQENCQSYAYLPILLNTFGYQGVGIDTNATKMLFMLLQSLRSTTLSHDRKLSNVQNVNVSRDLAIPPSNYQPAQFSTDLPEDFSFNEKLNSQLSFNDVSATITTIASAYDSYVQNLSSDQTHQIAVLLELATKEARISSCINESGDYLSGQLGYTFTPGQQNINALNYIFGFIPNSVTLVPNQPNQNSIASILQFVQNTSVILPFEISFITSGNQTFNPINEFLYYSDLGSLQTSGPYFQNLRSFLSRFATVINSIQNSILSLKLIPYEDRDDLTVDSENFYSVDLYQKIINKLQPFQNDPIGAIFSLAADDSNLRAILFYICAFNFLGPRRFSTRFSYANKSHALRALHNHLSLLRISSLTFGGTQQFPIQQILDALDQRLDIVDEICTVMSNASAFYASKNCFVNNKTSFISVNEMTLMMSIFHAITLHVKSITSKTIKSVSTANNTIEIATKLRRTPSIANTTLSLMKASYASSITQFYYFLQLFFNIIQKLTTLTMSASTPEFIRNIELVKNSLPNSSLISTLVLSQSIRNARFNINQLNQTLLNLASSNTTNTINLQILDQNFIDSNQFSLVQEYSRNIKNTSVILSIGIPVGTQRKLQVSSKQSNDPDVVKIKIFKVNQLQQNVVYKPIEFLFEMSRYVPIESTRFKDLLTTPTTDPTELIPTFDISSVNPTYDYGFSSLSEGRYGFLSDAQQKSLVKNHAKSWCIMQYVRYLTGLNIAETNFLMTPLTAQSMSNDVLEAFFNSRPFNNVDVRNSFVSFDNNVPPQQTSAYVREHYSVVNQLSRTTHFFSTQDHLVQKAITPNSFDRVFNIIFDESDFQIESGQETDVYANSKFFTYYAEIESLGGQ